MKPLLPALAVVLAGAACGGGDAPAPAPVIRSGPAVAAAAAPAKPAPSPTEAAALAVRRAFEPQPGFTALGKHKPGEWLDHFDELGQSVAQFERAERVVPSAQRRTIMILPIGPFSGQGSPPLALLADYVKRFFGLDAEVLPGLTDASVLHARHRVHYGVEQWLTADLLEALRQRVPPTAYGLVGVTMTDLFPDPSWNYVFGEARFAERVGVYSFARYDPAFHHERRGPGTEHRILERSLKIMSHEIGHMFGIAHCTAYRCLMNGTNSLEETDRSPMHFCPVCLHKLQLAVGFAPATRYAALQAFYAANGFSDEAKWAQERLAYLQAP